MNKSKIGQIGKELRNASEVVERMKMPGVTDWGLNRYLKELIPILQDINGLVDDLKKEVKDEQ
ncbi:hypothetical protein [Crocosphaera watsonii]|uniref:Uncharacterized protein n=2 Tax=Crocosphaera watsonii TaxID=263511 RepID=G5JDL7_CROWT|nr:hypothetical protein [Crocosphaera watsonii]EHJ09718.1 hypothetical protein CWATWH0003_5509 [Crocosphaera watsonii WH 0003]CCQ58892.1 hypothetical protein CWATWH0005_808 [Crocosphaera watsonii WH 0005]